MALPQLLQLRHPGCCPSDSCYLGCQQKIPGTAIRDHQYFLMIPSAMSGIRLYLLFLHLCFELSCTIHIDLDGVALADRSRKDQSRRQRLHIFLQIPFQRTGTVYRVITVINDMPSWPHPSALHGISLSASRLFRSSIISFTIALMLSLCQRLEHDGLIQTVQELRTEMCTQVIHDSCLRLRLGCYRSHQCPPADRRNRCWMS